MYDATRTMQQRPDGFPFVSGMLQRKTTWPQRSLSPGPNSSEASGVSSMVQNVLRTSGEPLDSKTREYVEPRFGYDFSNVRVHTDSHAASSARAVDALAYTVGSHLIFDRGQYAPQTIAGRQLLAHELAHSVQQSTVQSGFTSQLEIGRHDTSAEVEADNVSRHLDSGFNVTPFPSATPVLQREERPPQHSRPEDFGITLAVVDHGATRVAGQARSRLDEIYRSLSATNLGVLQSSGVTRIELHIIPYDKKIVDLPEFANLRGQRTPDGRLWDDVRGSGGRRVGSAIRYSVGEENLSGTRHGHGYAIGLGILGGVGIGAAGAALGEHIGSKAQGSGSGHGGLIGGIIGGVVGAAVGAVGLGLLGNLLDESNMSGYERDFTPSHEGAHTVELFALTAAQQARVQALFAARTAAHGPWLEPADYTSSNVHEYWAQCAAAFFSRPYESEYSSSYTPDWLRRNDPGMYALLVEVFGAPAAVGPTASSGATSAMPASAAA